jgi:hypothetical protein
LCTPALGSDTESQTSKTDVIVKVFFSTSQRRPSLPPQNKYTAPSIQKTSRFTPFEEVIAVCCDSTKQMQIRFISSGRRN